MGNVNFFDLNRTEVTGQNQPMQHFQVIVSNNSKFTLDFLDLNNENNNIILYTERIHSLNLADQISSSDESGTADSRSDKDFYMVVPSTNRVNIDGSSIIYNNNIKMNSISDNYYYLRHFFNKQDDRLDISELNPYSFL